MDWERSLSTNYLRLTLSLHFLHVLFCTLLKEVTHVLFLGYLVAYYS